MPRKNFDDEEEDDFPEEDEEDESDDEEDKEEDDEDKPVKKETRGRPRKDEIVKKSLGDVNSGDETEDDDGEKEESEEKKEEQEVGWQPVMRPVTLGVVNPKTNDFIGSSSFEEAVLLILSKILNHAEQADNQTK